MAVRMELSRILIRELNSYQIIELREVLDQDIGASGSIGSSPIGSSPIGSSSIGNGPVGTDASNKGEGASEATADADDAAQPGDSVDDSTGESSSDSIGEPVTRTFPIVIGLPEAQAIERRLKGELVKRPQTHDLLASVINLLGGRLRSITISDLNEHTFYATLDISRHNGELIHIDSRPSDAIALGVAGGVPILVAEHVLEAATRDEQ